MTLQKSNLTKINQDEDGFGGSSSSKNDNFVGRGGQSVGRGWDEVIDRMEESGRKLGEHQSGNSNQSQSSGHGHDRKHTDGRQNTHFLFLMAAVQITSSPILSHHWSIVS